MNDLIICNVKLNDDIISLFSNEKQCVLDTNSKELRLPDSNKTFKIDIDNNVMSHVYCLKSNLLALNNHNLVVKNEIISENKLNRKRTINFVDDAVNVKRRKIQDKELKTQIRNLTKLNKSIYDISKMLNIDASEILKHVEMDNQNEETKGKSKINCTKSENNLKPYLNDIYIEKKSTNINSLSQSNISDESDILHKKTLNEKISSNLKNKNDYTSELGFKIKVGNKVHVEKLRTTKTAKYPYLLINLKRVGASRNKLSPENIKHQYKLPSKSDRHLFETQRNVQQNYPHKTDNKRQSNFSALYHSKRSEKTPTNHVTQNLNIHSNKVQDYINRVSPNAVKSISGSSCDNADSCRDSGIETTGSLETNSSIDDIKDKRRLVMYSEKSREKENINKLRVCDTSMVVDMIQCFLLYPRPVLVPFDEYQNMVKNGYYYMDPSFCNYVTKESISLDWKKELTARDRYNVCVDRYRKLSKKVVDMINKSYSIREYKAYLVSIKANQSTQRNRWKKEVKCLVEISNKMNTEFNSYVFKEFKNQMNVLETILDKLESSLNEKL